MRKKLSKVRFDPELSSQIDKIEHEVRRRHREMHIRVENVQHGELLPMPLDRRVRRLINLGFIDKIDKEPKEYPTKESVSKNSSMRIPDSRLEVRSNIFQLFLMLVNSIGLLL